ncbi:universal stress protein [Pelistega europaea]|uniref:Universal stress protein n=1 Tax=Pelistega europaea TaxID=106147 RepID=A0A7Y4P747_9BURK|nr:universal stress protein [Pelistega europaea]NOL50370.1 universal stress protein [Pelistega europaea]
MARTYLVPYDASNNAKKALAWAISAAKLSGTRVRVINVQPSFGTVHAKALFNHKDIEEYQTQLFKENTEGVEDQLKASGLDYSLEMGVGDPKEVIVEKVKESHGTDNPIDLIIMGSRGTNPFFGGVLGSVSYAIINSGVCPVTIIPQEK